MKVKLLCTSTASHVHPQKENTKVYKAEFRSLIAQDSVEHMAATVESFKPLDYKTGQQYEVIIGGEEKRIVEARLVPRGGAA